MKKSYVLFLMTLLFFSVVGKAESNNLRIGMKFPIEKLTDRLDKPDNTLVVFVPSLTEDCEYASMLTQSFYYYFDQKLAFETSKKSPSASIFLIVGDKQDESRSAQNIIGGMKVVYDEKGELFAAFGVDKPSKKNSASTVVLLDSNDVIAHIDRDYRAQGEHLKPLENKLKELNEIYEKVPVGAIARKLKIGDKAPDFQINPSTRLAGLRGRVVLVSFYPAAFSGILPKRGEDLKWPTDPQAKPSAKDLMSCTFQIDSLDTFKKSIDDPIRIVVSSSTDSLLKKWKETLGTENIEYANDPDYSVSLKYFSYNPNGFNNRVSVIVDQKGKIAYIDEDFNFADEKILNDVMVRLLKRGKTGTN